MDMQVVELDLSPRRLDELIRWHGTDEDNLPPAHTLQNLSRDTVAALQELQHCRERIDGLRAALGEVFWIEDLRQMHARVLSALGPPPAPQDLAVPRERGT
jgi:hypothetical protein